VLFITFVWNRSQSEIIAAEILIQRVKKLQPEEIARKIEDFDQELCTQVFLSELKPVLPTPEQVPASHIFLSMITANMKSGR
jgi:hypothetical protein